MSWDHWVKALGGLGLLLYGMELAGDNLQLAAGRTMRRVLAAISDGRWRAAGIGALTAFLVNSSAVTGVVVVGLAGAGVLALGPALAVMAGGGLGSALTVQILAFKPAGAGPLLAAAGTALGMLARSDRLRIWSRILLAAGLVFWGMAFLSEGLEPAARHPLVRNLLCQASSPLAGFLFGIGMTVATGSSSATVAFLMALLQSTGERHMSGTTLVAAFGAVLGANLGTAVTPWVASRRSAPAARQAAAAYLFYKALLGICLLPLAWHLGDLVLVLTRRAAAAVAGDPRLLYADPARVVANLHLAVNLLGAIAAVTLSEALVGLTRRILPAPREPEALTPRYLDPETLKTPEVALAQARREILRFAATVREMLGGALEALRRDSPEFNKRLADRDERVDRLQRAVTEFLSALMARGITREESERAIALIGAADDLENISDAVVRDLLRLADKKARLGQDFSPAGWEELARFHAETMGLFAATLAAFEKEDAAAARACLDRGKALLQEEGGLRRSHIARLSAGLAESHETSAIHLDALHALGQVAGRLIDLSRTLLGKS